MKLYVWEDVLTDWTPGVMFALANNPDEARALLLKQCDFLPPEDLAKTPKEYEAPAAFYCWGGA